jgi:hypothetical protein
VAAAAAGNDLIAKGLTEARLHLGKGDHSVQSVS